MKLAYLKMMSSITGDIAWFWFFIEPTNRTSGKWWEAHLNYERQISKLQHPANRK